jgi:hypothetical protein
MIEQILPNNNEKYYRNFFKKKILDLNQTYVGGWRAGKKYKS